MPNNRAYHLDKVKHKPVIHTSWEWQLVERSGLGMGWLWEDKMTLRALLLTLKADIPPSPQEVCDVYQDFYTEEGYACANSQHYFDYSNGYMSGYELGYLDGYIAGYYP